MPSFTAEQKQAINEFGQNIIVSAGAGSGKTAVLSERVLTHVLDGMNIDDMLILTFTNAAAAEMKERIRNKLMDHPELKEQQDKIDLAYITTFDAYALSIVKKYHHLLNISSSLTIADASIITLKKEEILETIFEEYYAARNPLFLKLISDFCLKDDQEIFNAILNLNNKLDNLYNKTTYLQSYLDKYYNDNYLNNLLTAYENLISSKITSFKHQIDNLSSYVESSYLDKLTPIISPLLNSKTYADYKKNCLLKLPILRNAPDEAKAIKSSLNDLLKEIANLSRYNDLNEIKLSLLATRDYVAIIIELILKLDEGLTTFKKSESSYEFIDISKMAIDILAQNSDVATELKNKYREILIDEYQDTNDLQDIFISYIVNHNVYMVGDIKQSIYRFRNANPNLFKTKYDAYSKHEDGTKIDLNRNFRSRSEVIDGINLIFNLIMDNEIGGADYLATHQMIFGLTPYNAITSENYNMELLNYPLPEEKTYSKEEIEIFTIAQDIKNKVSTSYTIMDKESNQARSVTYADFVILMDRATSFPLYKKIFEYLNIPLTIYRDQTISDSIDISLIKNIYNIIILIKNHTFDKQFAYSYMAIARSYLFNLDDALIFKTIKERSYSDTAIYAICYNLARNLSNLTNQELYDAILNEFNFYEKIITVGNIEEHLITLDSIGKIIASTVSLGYTPEDFLNYLNEVASSGLAISLSLNKEASNSVKIMTIHASKGLEYPICYFSGLSKKFNIDDLKSKFYFDDTYGFITPYLNNGPHSTILKTLLQQKYIMAEISEKIRLFYVALTRAREKIILVTHLEPNLLAYKENGVINDETRLNYLSFNDILSSIYNSLAKYMTSVDIVSLNLTKAYNLSKQTASSKLPEGNEIIPVTEYIAVTKTITNTHLSKESHTLHTEEETTNLELGIRMHYLLEITDFNHPNYSNMNSFEQSCIESFISTHIYDHAQSIYKEYEFYYPHLNNIEHGIIDLLIVKEQECLIIDYKLKHITDTAYLDQLHGYQSYIQELINKPVQIYLYSLIDKKLIKLN